MEHADSYGYVFPVCEVLCGWDVYYGVDDAGTA